MQARELNLLNIGLMIISCILAFLIPFELFLFSYAVLGPLHYLTEISWLHQRNYFVEGKYDFLWLILLALLATLAFFGVSQLNTISLIAPYIALLSALSFYLVKNKYLKIVSVLLVFVSALSFNDSIFFYTFFIIFLPTIIHVFIFTGAFILYGALKSKSSSGIFSLVVFILCASSFFLIVPENHGYDVSQYVQNAYRDFSVLNQYLINFFQLSELKTFDQQSFSAIFSSTAGFIVMRFIAFAYTYHYLNWFSKTSVIKWHKVDRKYLIGTLAAWVIAVGVYIFDYKSGLKLLFFLSFLHVFLEFPLNCKTFIEIGKEMRGFRFSKSINAN